MAKKYKVSTAGVRRLKQRRPETGSIEALPWNGGRRRRLSDAQGERLKDLWERIPEATVDELHKRRESSVAAAQAMSRGAALV